MSKLGGNCLGGICRSECSTGWVRTQRQRPPQIICFFKKRQVDQGVLKTQAMKLGHLQMSELSKSYEWDLECLIEKQREILSLKSNALDPLIEMNMKCDKFHRREN